MTFHYPIIPVTPRGTWEEAGRVYTFVPTTAIAADVLAFLRQWLNKRLQKRKVTGDMRFNNLSAYLAHGRKHARKGPVAILLMEDLSETSSTIRHHLGLGFRHVVVVGPAELNVPQKEEARVSVVVHDLGLDGGGIDVVNQIAATLAGEWIYYGYNAEYLFYPFCETRTIGEMTSFVTEERRDSVLTYVVDLYPDDLTDFPNSLSPQDAYLDKCGYYAHSRSRNGQTMEQQLDMFGGLRWRFEEHVKAGRRKIDRMAIFRARKDLKLRANDTLDHEEMNTYSSPWHHSLTAAIGSFRAAKSLKTNPGSSQEIDSFLWHNSQKFNWHSSQLLELGLMEPGQWF